MNIRDQSKGNQPRRSHLSQGQAGPFVTPGKMLQGATYFLVAATLIHCQPGPSSHTNASQEPSGSSLVWGLGPPPSPSEDKSTTDLATKLLLLDELVSLENDVTETKKKRSFPGFGSPLDRLSMGSVDLKAKQRKVVDVPKQRFGIPLDRIGMNRLSNSRG